MKLYKAFRDTDSYTEDTSFIPFTKKLNDWIKKNHKKYVYQVAMPLQKDGSYTNGVLIAYSPKYSKGHSMK